MKENGLILIALSGFFMSISFPTFMVIISSTFKKNSSYAIGLIVTMCNILFVVLFNITGALNDLIGTYKAFYAIPLSIIASIFMLINISRKTKDAN